jgi:YXWGXW repeat-containing protein
MSLRRFCCIVLLSVGVAGIPLASSQAQVICTGNASPPPELPVYDQPPMPGPGYIWTPGYWGGGPLGYFWVPGTWVEPPAVGLLWTPGYWGFRDGIYVWNAGYWGPHIGFYGGVHYGFGYSGVGYEGGRWVNGVFSYNRTVNNFGSVHIANAYDETVVVNNVTRVSFNGGPGGTAVRPTPEEENVVRERHVAAIPAQLQHERTAGTNKALLASENHGRPAIAATAKPGEFSGKGVIAAREAKPGQEHLQIPSHLGTPAAAIGNKPTPPGAERLHTPGNIGAPPAAVGNKQTEHEEKEKRKETVKQESEPKPPANNVEPANAAPKRSHEQVKLPADKEDASKLRAKQPEGAAGAPGAAGAGGAAHQPPQVAAGRNPHLKPKPGAEDKKQPQ